MRGPRPGGRPSNAQNPARRKCFFFVNGDFWFIYTFCNQTMGACACREKGPEVALPESEMLWDDVFWFLTRGYVSKDATCMYCGYIHTPLCNLLHGKDVLM